ncbi:MAG: phosphoglycerol transferase MdoB-like AlkP superfamily enzyme [Flavobacteriaceae bacterium]|jgi:phosphoglycerol transferase MdoB-like AlkP superfamily enzyme
MKDQKNKLPSHVISLLKRLGIALLLLQITRLIFFLYNQAAFHDLHFSDVFAGMWFDIITISLIYLPYAALFLAPLPHRDKKWYRIFFKATFHLLCAGMIALNLIDSAYYQYTLKRSTRDLIDAIFTGNDFNQLYATFLSENIVLIAIFIVLILITEFLYRSTSFQTEAPSAKRFYRSNVFWMVGFCSLLVLLGRGGIRPKPIGILDASNFTRTENTAIILNTPFTFLKTIAIDGLEEKNYFSRETELSLFNPIRKSQPANILPDNTNVVVIILESFGMEFVGAVSGEKSYTPFLDSLIDQSLYFPYAFANGKRSVEAVPAIIASMPSWMPDSYLSSPYADNNINTLPNLLKEKGYTSAFFHGATNGSMRFDSFATTAGFEHYFGRNEYPNDAHFDGTWAISDAYFNPWVAKKIATLPEPFCSVLFTTSSHHPYVIPNEFKKITEQGPQKICGSISYSDHALRLFFEEAKKQAWFDNTLFVFVADHSPASNTPLYTNRTHMYRIPLAFYHPSGLLLPEKNRLVAQQMDIFPTVLDLINAKCTYYSFGESLLQDHEGQGIAYLQGSYYHFSGDYMLVFSSEKAQNLFNFTIGQVASPDSLAFYKNNVRTSERILKAMIQRYNRDLILNKTSVD